MPRALIVEIFGNAKQFGAELDRAAGKTQRFGKAAGVAGLAIAGGLAYGLEKSVKAAMGAQVSTARLEQAFKTSGESAGKYADQIGKAESKGRDLGFMNTELRTSIGSLEIATHNHAIALRSLSVAEDLARFKQIDLTSATKMLTMAQTGSQRGLKQLGLTMAPVTQAQDAQKAAFGQATLKIREHYAALGTLSNAQKRQEEAALMNAKSAEHEALSTAKVTDTQKTAASITDLLNKKLHGQADAYSQTAAGGMQRFHAQVEQIQESLGLALLPAVTAITAKLAVFASWMSKHATLAKILVIGLGALAVAMMAFSVATSIAAAATTALDIALSPLLIPIAAVIAGVVLLGIAAYELVKHWGTVKAFFSNLWGDIKGVFDAGINFVKDHWRAFAVALATIVAGPLGLLVSMIATHWGQIKAGAMAGWNAIKSVIGNAVGAIQNIVSNIWDGVKAAWSAAWNALVGIVKREVGGILSIINSILGPIRSAISLLNTLFSSSHHAGPPGGPRGWGPRPPGHHALGGIFTQPTLGWIGEAGPEAVIPLSRRGTLSNLMGGGRPVIVNVHGWVGNDQQLAVRIRDELVVLGRREPNIFGGFA